jgi:DNA-binding NarL/FixJ family response regulator
MAHGDTPPGDVRVIVIEDRLDTREGLRFLINNTDGYQCAAAFDTMESALAALGSDPADVALVDLGLPGMSGIDGIRELRARYPELALVALTVYHDDARIFEALCAGARAISCKRRRRRGCSSRCAT